MQDRYYRHSGRFSVVALVQALTVGLLVSVPMAFVYAYAIVYIPIIGVVSFILTAGFAGVVGLATGALLHKGKVRNNAVATLTALPVGLFALWMSWVAWIYALLNRADAGIGLLDLTLNPSGLWAVINIVNDKGAWSLKGLTPTGIALWILWAIEAVMIVGIIVLAAKTMVDDPFCEECDRWHEEQKSFAVLGPTTKDALAPRLERGEYDVIREMTGATANDYTQLDLHQCSKCQGTAALTATGVSIVLKNGKQEKNEKVLVKHLLLSPSDLSTVRSILAEPAPREQPAA